ncbi:MAG: chitobiase/beta-hexosaminidase C-terminal domain-containing protein [Spirochaetes bacterium]|nr:chitobiase/beta-hexosaminidase C-terminal domain-containing protein [Spirochaetota bacterium]
MEKFLFLPKTGRRNKVRWIIVSLLTCLTMILSCQKLIPSQTEEEVDESSGSTGESVAPPTFSVNGGTYTESQTVTLQCATLGATIKYTTDGSDPRTSATVVVGNTVFVSMPMRIRAYATKTGMKDSAVATSDLFSITSGIVFVSAVGNDANQGTKDFPKKTIQAGIELAYSLFETGEVRVAQGVYPTYGGITLKSGISVYGSYKTDFSARSLSSAITTIEDRRTSGTCFAVIAQDITRSLVFDGFVVKGANTSSGDSFCVYTRNCQDFLTIRNNTIVSGVSESTCTGIYIKNGSPLIYNNVMYGGMAGNNIKISVASGNPIIYNNTIVSGTANNNSYRLLINLYTTYTVKIKNNLFIDLDSTSINSLLLAYSGGLFAITTNLFYMYPDATGEGAYVYYYPQSSGNVNINNYTTTPVYTSSDAQPLTYNDPAWRNLVNQDPLFVNPAANNYHLQASSPARAAGTDLSSEIPAFDRDGNPRTVPWSIGAYERD